MTKKALGTSLGERGYIAGKIDRARGWHGIALDFSVGRGENDPGSEGL